MSEKIPKGWKWVKLGEVVTLQRGYDLPKSKMKKGNIPVVGSNGIIGYHNKATTKAPGITIGRSGNIGNAYLHKSDFWAHNTTLYVKDFKGNDVIFLFYLFKNIDFNQLNAGSAVPTLNRNHIYPIEVKIPIKIEEQKAIAEVLSSIDDKIDLLHRQNKTLEEMAMKLFRKWFIEDAKEDWEECILDDLCLKIASGGTPSTKIKEYYDGRINWYSTKELNDCFLFESEKKITLQGLENSSAKLFPKGTIVMAIYAAPTVGRLGILANEASFNQAACGLIPNTEVCSKEFLYLYLKNERENLNTMATGSAQQNLNVNKIKTYPTIKVPKNIMIRFNKIVIPIFHKIENNSYQIQTLEKLRDTLLPKLMSGEVRIMK